jgi:hypothetical protein
VAVCGKFSLSALGWWNWQTRTFEGRMPKGLRVQVPPRAQFPAILSVLRLIVQNRWLSSKQVEPIRNSSNIMHLRSIKLHRRRVSTCPAKKGSCSKRVGTPRRSNPSERIDNWVANTRYQRQRGRGEDDPVLVECVMQLARRGKCARVCKSRAVRMGLRPTSRLGPIELRCDAIESRK